MTGTEAHELKKIRGLVKRVEYFTSPTLSEKEVILFLAEVMPQTSCLALPELLKSDLTTYPVFTAIDMWCDPNYGIGREYPVEITRIAEVLLHRYHKGAL